MTNNQEEMSKTPLVFSRKGLLQLATSPVRRMAFEKLTGVVQ